MAMEVVIGTSVVDNSEARWMWRSRDLKQHLSWVNIIKLKGAAVLVLKFLILSSLMLFGLKFFLDW